jgi:hypothetical protein
MITNNSSARILPDEETPIHRAAMLEVLLILEGVIARDGEEQAEYDGFVIDLRQ